MFRSKRIELTKKQNPIIKLFKYIIIFSIIWWFFILYSYSNFTTINLVDDEIFIKIEKWEKTDSIANKLSINKYYFKLFLKNVKKEDPNFEIKAWNFKIEANSNINQILEWLKKPIILGEINVTILEWWNIYDIDEYLTNKNLINSWEYISYVNNNEKIFELSKLWFDFIEWLETLEWFLYPDTYRVDSDNFKINNFVIKQLNSFKSKVYEKLLLDKNNKEIEKLINLSSIVEKEEKDNNEKSTVAWILKKRLDEWWMIWADATVCYPHKLTSQECKLVVSKYIKEKSEYNTRTMTWLPKTPIWNPSFDTINATLNYKETIYWFYLHNVKTGKIYYAKTNSEHEENKKKYMK